MKKLLYLLIFTAFILQGCTGRNIKTAANNEPVEKTTIPTKVYSNEKMPLLSVADIVSLQVNLGLPSNRKPPLLNSMNEYDNKIIKKVVNWLNSSETIGNEKFYGKHGYPTTVSIKLRNGDYIFIEPAYIINVTKKRDGNTTFTGSQIKGEVVFEKRNQDDKLLKRIRLKSPEVYDWLKEKWREDVLVISHQ